VNTFLWYLELSALGNLDGLDGLVAGTLGHVLNLVDDLVALKDLAEDDVAAIEPAGDDGGNEELAPIGVLILTISSWVVVAWRIPYLSAVGHAEKTLAGVLQLEVLIWELCAVDGLAASTVTFGKITARG
jgi:hypothetical protein